MKLNYDPGKEMFVDYSVKKLQVIDRETREDKKVQVFVAILLNSQYTYVEACSDHSRECFIESIKNALRFFGVVPKAIVTDNLKSAVFRSCKNEPIINRSLKEIMSIKTD